MLIIKKMFIDYTLNVEIICIVFKQILFLMYIHFLYIIITNNTLISNLIKIYFRYAKLNYLLIHPYA